MYDGATYFAWFVLALLFFVAVCFVVWLGSMPRKIAAARNHPQVDAINACSWIGLALGGVGWPIAFVWAFLRSAPIGAEVPNELTEPKPNEEVTQLRARISELESKIAAINDKEDLA